MYIFLYIFCGCILSFIVLFIIPSYWIISSCKSDQVRKMLPNYMNIQRTMLMLSLQMGSQFLSYSLCIFYSAMDIHIGKIESKNIWTSQIPRKIIPSYTPNTNTCAHVVQSILRGSLSLKNFKSKSYLTFYTVVPVTRATVRMIISNMEI